MAEITSLILAVDSRQVTSATGALDRFGKAGGVAERQSAALANATRSLSSAFGGVAAALSVAQIVRYADAYQQVNARLRLVTSSQAAFVKVQGELIGQADRTRVSLTDTIDLYTRIARATQGITSSDSDRLKITETINKALIVSGTSGAAAAGALTQLGQAFGGGIVRAEEFNSILEGAPRIIQAVADGLGVTIGQLRELVLAGNLTSGKLFTSLLSQSENLTREFEKIPSTIGQALTVAENRLTAFIGGTSEVSGAGRAVAQTIDLLSRNIDVLTAAAAGFAAARLASVLLTAASAAQANALAVAQTVAASRVQATTSAGLSVILTRQTAAQLALNTAQGAGAVTATAASRAIGFLGGPIGIITTLLGLGSAAWVLWGNDAEDAISKAKEIGNIDINNSLDDQIRKLQQRVKIATTGDTVVAQAQGEEAERLLSIQQRINVLLDKRRAGTLTGSDQIGLIELQGEYDQIAGKIRTVQGLQDQVASFGRSTKASDWLKEYATDTERLTAELEKARKELGDKFTPELERRIRDRFRPKGTRARAPKQRAPDVLGFDIAEIQRALTEVTGQFAIAESIFEAQRNAGLVSDRDYYTAKTALLEANTAAQIKALTAESARLAQEKGDAAETLKNQERIADNDARIAILRAQASGQITVLGIQQKASNDAAAKSFRDAEAAAQDYLDTLRLSQQRQLAGIGQGTQARERDAGAQGIQDDFERQRQQLFRQRQDAEIQGTFTPESQRIYDERLQLIRESEIEASRIYQDGFDKRLVMESNFNKGVSEFLNNYLTDVANVSKSTEQLFQRSFQGLEDALTSFVTTGKLSFSSLASTIVAEIARIIVKQQIANALAAASPYFSGGGGILGDIFGAVLGSSTGGSGSISGGSGLKLGRAIGGPVSAGGIYPINEKGPGEILNAGGMQYLLAAKNGTVQPVSQQKAGNTVNVTVNQSFPSNTSRATTLQAASDARRVLESSGRNL